MLVVVVGVMVSVTVRYRAASVRFHQMLDVGIAL